MSAEEKQDQRKNMLTDDFIDHLEKELAPEAIEKSEGDEGSPAIRFEVVLAVDKETGKISIVNQDVSMGLLRDKEN